MNHSVAILGVTVLAWNAAIGLRRPEGGEPWYVVILALAALVFWVWFIIAANQAEGERKALREALKKREVENDSSGPLA